jgi:hypothetical protein
VLKYRKKPVEIEAIQFTGENWEEIDQFLTVDYEKYPIGKLIRIPTLEGTMACDRGDYIIKGIKSEFYPCKPDIFEATYDKVEAK